MNKAKTLKSYLKTLPVVSLLITGIALSPAIAYADKDKGYYSEHSHERGQSHHRKESKKHINRRYNEKGRLHGKTFRYYREHQPKHHRNNWRGYTVEHRYKHHSHRQPVYIVNDYYYLDDLPRLDRFGIMLGIHTGNVDISFHD